MFRIVLFYNGNIPYRGYWFPINVGMLATCGGRYGSLFPPHCDINRLYIGLYLA